MFIAIYMIGVIAIEELVRRLIVKKTRRFWACVFGCIFFQVGFFILWGVYIERVGVLIPTEPRLYVQLIGVSISAGFLSTKPFKLNNGTFDYPEGAILPAERVRKIRNGK